MQRPGRVVELFAGVGGFRLGLEQRLVDFTPEEGFRWEADPARAWEVVWANQWEPSTKAQPAFLNYQENLVREGRDPSHAVNVDIAEVLDAELGTDGTDAREPGRYGFPEEFELLVGGFPCQDYSVAKPLSQATGIEGQKGVLWWQIHRILEVKKPAHVLLENVDRLLKSPSTQRGRDFAVMLACFARLGYRVEWRVVNAADHGFPQRRKRVFIYATLEDDGLHLDGDRADLQTDEVAGAWGRRLIGEDGVLAHALPCELGGPGEFVALGQDDDLDPFDVSQTFGRSERGAAARSPFRTAGVMSRGVVWTADVWVDPDQSPARPGSTLGEILQPVEAVLNEHPEVVIPAHQLDFDASGEDGRARRGTWNYLKGAKAEERTKPGGFTYTYTEGAVGFPEPLNRASRTVLTGEGGRAPSRFKLVVKQAVSDALLAEAPLDVRDAGVVDEEGDLVVYRRLTPVELERLDTFPDGWTAPLPGKAVMSANKRAFCVGNALVAGVVDLIGRELTRRSASAEAVGHLRAV